MALLDTVVGIRIKLGATEDDAVEMTTVTLEVEYPEFPDPWQWIRTAKAMLLISVWAFTNADVWADLWHQSATRGVTLALGLMAIGAVLLNLLERKKA